MGLTRGWGLLRWSFFVMACACFLPSCRVCADTCFDEPAGRAACSCLLHGCPACFPEPRATTFAAGKTRLTGQGRPATPEMAAVIATIDARLREMLSEPPRLPAYLLLGPEYLALPTQKTDGTSRGSRHDHLIAFLCQVGVDVVQAARSAAVSATRDGAEELAPAAPRGRSKRQSSENCVEEVVAPEEPMAEFEVKLPGQKKLSGVTGHYVQASEENPDEHAIALVLGRVYAYALTNNISENVVSGFLSLLHLAGVNVGQKHHSRVALSSFSGIAARLCTKATSTLFFQRPRNLPHPSAWRLVFDGVTLPNGTTVTVVLIVFTAPDGRIVVEFLGCASGGARSDAQHTARAILDLLEDRVQVLSRQATCSASIGLPLDMRDGTTKRGVFLTCIPCDRAYCGRTGSGADAVLAEQLGVHGVFGIKRRIGAADLLHCYDSCASRFWRPVEKRGDDNDDSSSASLSGAHSEEVKHAPLTAWVRVCKRLRSLLGRGHGNFHLANGYNACQVTGRPKISVPSNTRMIVYSSSFLRQSFAHYKARYQALWSYKASLTERAVADRHGHGRHERRARQVQRLGKAFADYRVLMQPLLTHAVLTLPGGFISGALTAQRTAEVFFPLHVRTTSVLWHLRHLASLPPAVARRKASLCRVAGPATTQAQRRAAALVPCCRCSACGLLKQRPVELFEHTKACHLRRDGEPRHENQRTALLSPMRTYRKHALFELTPWEIPGPEAVVHSPFECLALRQPGAAPFSLWELTGCLKVLACLLQFAVFPSDTAHRRRVPITDWVEVLRLSPDARDCCRWFVVALGGTRWRMARTWWTFCLEFVFSGHWKGCNVEAFRALGPPDRDSDRWSFRSSVAARRAICKAVEAMESTRLFFRSLAEAFDVDVVHSHGDHVPLEVRSAATVLFWLPDILTDSRLRERVLRPDEERAVWADRMDFLSRVLAYVAGQVDVFVWPTTEETMRQYQGLMRAWARLLRDPRIRGNAWSPCRVAGHSSFQWAWWWQRSHTDERFCPAGCEAAFVLYHFTGMFGVSEARAESIASVLKRFSPPGSSRLATDRVTEKAILKSSGITGDGSDDLFLLRCWVEFFGGLQKEKFTFHYTHRRRRQQKFPWGGAAQR